MVSSTKKEESYLRGPRLLSTFDPEGDTLRCVRDNLTYVQLEAADGSGALMIVKTIRLSVGPKSIQEVLCCCWISSDLILFDEITEKPCDTGHVDSLCNTRKLVRH